LLDDRRMRIRTSDQLIRIRIQEVQGSESPTMVLFMTLSVLGGDPDPDPVTVDP
jgi:hypothetical protein